MPRILAIALILLVASPAQAADKTLDRTFAVSPGGSLVVDADGASIRVSGADTSQVTVRMK
jgi:opacity protein-like surface antigen